VTASITGIATGRGGQDVSQGLERLAGGGVSAQESSRRKEMAVDVTSDIVGFAKKITDSEFAKIASAVSVIGGAISFLVGLFSEDDTEKILQRIDQLEDSLRRGLLEIGNLIRQQTDFIRLQFEIHDHEQIRAEAMTAEGDLLTYRNLDERQPLFLANDRSRFATALLLAQPQPHDPFWLGALLLAGTVRIDVIRALDPDFFAKPGWPDEIYELADTLESMLDVIKGQVNRSHVIVEERRVDESEPQRDSPGGIRPTTRVVIHRHHGVDIDVFLYAQRHLAEPARRRGVTAELEALGIPQYEQIVQTWRSIPAQHMYRRLKERLLGQRANRLDLDLASRARFFTEPTRLRRRLSLREDRDLAVDTARRPERSTWVLNADVRPALVDIVTSAEFHERFIEPDPPAGKMVRLVMQRIFDRDVADAEVKVLTQMQNYLGVDGLVAGLVYGKEYSGKFGKGIPIIAGQTKVPSETPESPARAE
jgi:hypothetical protein